MAGPKKPTPSKMMPDPGMPKKAPAKGKTPAPAKKPAGVRGIKGKTAAY